MQLTMTYSFLACIIISSYVCSIKAINDSHYHNQPQRRKQQQRHDEHPGPPKNEDDGSFIVPPGQRIDIPLLELPAVVTSVHQQKWKRMKSTGRQNEGRILSILTIGNDKLSSQWRTRTSRHGTILSPSNHVEPRIVGGNEASANEYPWYCALYRNRSGNETRRDFYCGGNLISPSFVLTGKLCR